MCLEEPPEEKRRSTRIKALEEKRKRERQALVEAKKKKAIAPIEIRKNNNKCKGKKKVHYVDDNDDCWNLSYEKYDILHNSNTRKRTRKSMSIEYLISKTKGRQNSGADNSKRKRSTTELQRRYTYRPPNTKDCLFSQVLNSPQQLILQEEPNNDNYLERMIQFVSGLNGNVQSIASKKPDSFNMRDLMIVANSIPETQNLHFAENQITPQQPISQHETTLNMDPYMLSSPSPSAIDDESQFLPYAPVLSHIALSIPSADGVAYKAGNVTVIDESQFFPPAPLLSNRALAIPGADADSCPSRNVTAINDNCKLNDKGKSKMVYEDKNQKGCAAAILANIFLRYGKNGSTSGNKGESSDNASIRASLLPGRIVNDDNAIGITRGNDCKEKPNSRCFGLGEGTDDEDCQILFVTDGLNGKNNGQREMADAVNCHVINEININEAHFVPPVLSNKARSIAGADAVACEARNVTGFDESRYQLFPQAPLLSNNALWMARADAVSCQSRNMTTINDSSQFNDKGESRMVYEDQNWKACAATILGSIFLKYDKNRSTGGTKGASSNNGQGRMPAEVIEPSSYVADMPQRAGRPLTQVWPTRVISGPQPKPLEGITENTLTRALSSPWQRTRFLGDLNSSMKTPGVFTSQKVNINQLRPLDDLNSSMRTPGIFSSQPGIVEESMMNCNIYTKTAFPSENEYFPTRGLVQSTLDGSDNSCQPGVFQELLGSFDENIPTWGKSEAALIFPGNSYRPGGFMELLSSTDIDYSSLELNNNQVITANADVQVLPNNQIMNLPKFRLQEQLGLPPLAPEMLCGNVLTSYEKAALSSDSLVSASALLWDYDQELNLALQL